MLPPRRRTLNNRDNAYAQGLAWFACSHRHLLFLIRVLLSSHEFGCVCALQELLVAKGLKRGSGASGNLFEVVLCRNHCVADTNWQQRASGRKWDTLKPLSTNGFDLSSTILIDDSAQKVSPGESANLILLPTFVGTGQPVQPAPEAFHAAAAQQQALQPQPWGWPADESDVAQQGGAPIMRSLCVLLLQEVGLLEQGADVRDALPAVRRALNEVCRQPHVPNSQ